MLAQEKGAETLVGLTERVAQERLQREGFNELPSSRKRGILAVAFEVAREPMFLLLLAGGAIYLAAPPKKGAELTGVANRSTDDKESILDAGLAFFEADPYRGWAYDQYFSAALAIEDAGDQSVKGRVYLALDDSGKSSLVGAFEAKRCAAIE